MKRIRIPLIMDMMTEKIHAGKCFCQYDSKDKKFLPWFPWGTRMQCVYCNAYYFHTDGHYHHGQIIGWAYSWMPEKYKVIGTNRVVTIEKKIGDNRYLCTDENDKSHPCYCAEDLKAI